MNDFVPLRIISCYSFLQSGLTIEKIAFSVKTNDYFGMGLCDNGVLFGVPSFVKASESIKKPYIIGMEVNVNDDYLCLYAINEEGYHHLIEINLVSQKEALCLEFLKEKSSGLIAIIETNQGQFNELFLNNDPSFNRYLFNYSEVFKDAFYLGLDIICQADVEYANKVRVFAKEHSYECIAFPKIVYQKKEDAIVLEIVEAIAKEETLDKDKQDGQQYFMPYHYYQKIYTSEEILNTQKVLNVSSFDFHKKRGELLHYPVNDSIKTLRDNCFNALKGLRLADNELYVKRLNYELETIVSLGYADYFLIVQDYVSYAKNHDVLVGPGRGSAAGSLVSYLLNITQIDPLKYDLQFERFLNPYRKSMPDIDVDFMDIRRDEVVEYMRLKYGKERVANIVTFQTIQAKQSLRDIGRVYGFANKDIDDLSKRITVSNITLRQAYKTLPEFRQLVDSDKAYLKIVSLASKIEGLIRQSGMHAAGIILNNSPLENALPVLVDSSSHYLSQYEMGCLEEQGFLKMDFLGLRNLTTISLCVDLINDHHPETKLDKQNLPFDDPKIYQLINAHQTLGLFQIETSAMRKAIQTIKPNCFDDIVALLAINRPGPMEYMDLFAKRKEGKEKVIYDDISLKPIVESTFGILIYQEQINQVATTFAGYTMGEADMFRRVVSKKNKEEMAKSKETFIKKAIANGHDEKTATKVFGLIERFANYGFNKSHSVAYSMIACQMAYLKVFYPLEFYAAILETSSSASDAKFSDYISEMKKRNIHIIAPDINYSSKAFIVKDNGLLFPLNSIHGINEMFVNNLLEERKDKPFKDFFDFVARMYRFKINENQIVALIDAGCFDAFNPSRASFRASVRNALQYAELVYHEDGQIDLGFSDYVKPYLIEDQDDPIENLNKEYDVLGIMLSSNPLRLKADILKEKHVIDINIAKERDNAIIAGLIKSIKTITTKKGTTMAYVGLYDESDEIELRVFPELYISSRSLLKKNNIIIVKINRQKYKDEYVYISDEISMLED